MSNQFKVNINGRTVSAEVGTVLSDLLNIEKPCGGRGTCGKCKVLVNGEDKLACRYEIRSDIEVRTHETAEIFAPTGTETVGTLTENLAFCLDIGTTTLALALVSLDEKKTVKVITANNPQRAFGADVITRIEYCQRKTVKELHDVLVDEINRMIESFDVTAQRMYVSANVTMLHTFFGVDCSSIGVAPYTPAFLEERKETAENIGIRGVREVVSLPSIASFVGADIVAGICSIGLPEEDEYNLLVDLGTNAEIVLYSRASGVAASAAAGPCFEGANIACGMSATNGAVYAFSLDYGHASYKTIADVPAKGICGTGLVDCVAELLKNGIIDETGYMDGNYKIADDVFLTPEDVRQYQLAKSAVCSAILSLMKTEGVGFDKISKLYISGGFSAKINIASAVASGLLPKELAAKTVALNNSSLQGTIKFATEGDNLDSFIDTTRYVDLSSNQHFAELFMKNMGF